MFKYIFRPSGTRWYKQNFKNVTLRPGFYVLKNFTPNFSDPCFQFIFNQEYVGLRANYTIWSVKTCLAHFLVVITAVNHAV